MATIIDGYRYLLVVPPPTLCETVELVVVAAPFLIVLLAASFHASWLGQNALQIPPAPPLSG